MSLVNRRNAGDDNGPGDDCKPIFSREV